MGPERLGLGFEDGFWVLRLGFGSRDMDLDYEARFDLGKGGVKEEGEGENFPHV